MLPQITPSDIKEAVEGFSEDKLQQVLTYIDTLRNNGARPVPGSIEAVLNAAGTWWMNSEETADFLRDIEEMRRAENPERELPPRY